MCRKLHGVLKIFGLSSARFILSGNTAVPHTVVTPGKMQVLRSPVRDTALAAVRVCDSPDNATEHPGGPIAFSQNA